MAPEEDHDREQGGGRERSRVAAGESRATIRTGEKKKEGKKRRRKGRKEEGKKLIASSAAQSAPIRPKPPENSLGEHLSSLPHLRA